VEKDTTYVALDDSKRKIVAGILRPGDTTPELRELVNDPHQIRRVFERLKREGPVAACYEAGVSGYDLYRQLTTLGVACAVIAPALTPRRPGQRIKTDRRDAAKLVRLFRAGELTAIHVLDESEEAVRDLVGCRDDVRRDVLRWRHRVLKLLARHGRTYLAGKNWSQAHWRWIREQRFDLAPLQRAFEATVFALEQALARQTELDKELEAVAETAPYREPVGWLRCFRGIDTLSGAGLCAEIGDWRRFAKPTRVSGFVGIVPSERTSDTKRRQGSITKAGSGHARRLLVEAAQHYRYPPRIGQTLARRQHGQDPRVIAIAWRAQQRLHARWQHLHHDRRKPSGVVAIAVARELAAFCWEAATLD
jgi:transposase